MLAMYRYRSAFYRYTIPKKSNDTLYCLHFIRLLPTVNPSFQPSAKNDFSCIYKKICNNYRFLYVLNFICC